MPKRQVTIHVLLCYVRIQVTNIITMKPFLLLFVVIISIFILFNYFVTSNHLNFICLASWWLARSIGGIQLNLICFDRWYTGTWWGINIGGINHNPMLNKWHRCPLAHVIHWGRDMPVQIKGKPRRFNLGGKQFK